MLNILKPLNCLNLWRWNNWKSVHDSIWVFFSDFGNEESSHAWASAPSKRVSELEALQTVARFRLFAHHVQHRVNQLRTFRIMTFGPVVPGTRLAKNEVVGSEKISKLTASVIGDWKFCLNSIIPLCELDLTPLDLLY